MSLLEIIFKKKHHEIIPQFLAGALTMYLLDIVIVSVALERYSKSDVFVMFFVVGGLVFILVAVVAAIAYYKSKADSLKHGD